jgi:hypothetical protein
MYTYILAIPVEGGKTVPAAENRRFAEGMKLMVSNCEAGENDSCYFAGNYI